MVKKNRGKLYWIDIKSSYPLPYPQKKLELKVLKGQQLQFTYNIDNNCSYLIS